MRALCFLVPLLVISVVSSAQIDNVGAGRALRLDGVDDYVDLGNILDDLNVPFSVSAWVYIDPASTGAFPILVSQDNDAIYNGFWMFVSPVRFWIECGDGRGENLPDYRWGKAADLPNLKGRWIHLTAVVKSMYDIDLYVNGILVPSQPTGNSDQPMASNYPNDVAKIGYFLSNSVTYRFKGTMDEVRVWNRALNAAEIQRKMCKKITQAEPGLIGCWSFNETSGSIINDNSINNFTGHLIGNPTRVFSGAPIGDESLPLYTSNWVGKTIKMDYVEAANILGNPGGIHIYKINSVPSQINGLDPSVTASPYYGIFVASIYETGSFDLKNLCKASARNDNSENLWNSLTTLTAIPNRKEIAAAPGQMLADVDLGKDIVLCNQSNYVLDTHIGNSGTTNVIWSNGKTTPAIVVTQSGTYHVLVSNSCGMQRDTIAVNFMNKPLVFDFGDDKILCNAKSMVLTPYAGNTNATGLAYHWQDGSAGESLTVSSNGKYWVTAQNSCGLTSDTITVAFSAKPAPFQLGDDQTLCDSKPRSLSPYPGNNSLGDLEFEWQDGSTGTTLAINTEGKYWVSVKNSCGLETDTVTFKKAPTGPLEIPNIITPNNDPLNQYFVLPPDAGSIRLSVFNRWGEEVLFSPVYKNDWDGAGLPSGVYYYTLYNACLGEKRGSITLSR